MSKLLFDQTGERLYETGVKECALFVYNPVKDNGEGKAKGGYDSGVAWNGITAITETPSGAEATPLYADDIKYVNLVSVEEFGATIEAYMYPNAFAACNGEAQLGGVAGVYVGQQTRNKFAIAYKTTVGNDTELNAHGYKLHIVYNCLAAVSEKAYATINDSPEAMTLSWEVSTTAEPVGTVNNVEYKPTSIITIDTTKLDENGKKNLATLEAKLYGSESESATLVLPNEVYTIMSAAAQS